MIEAHGRERLRSFNSGQQAAKGERKLSPWTKPLIKEIEIGLPGGYNRYERQGEPGKGKERKQSPWGKPLPEEKASGSPETGKRCEGHEEHARQEKIRQIKDRLSSLGAAKEKARAWSDRKEKEGTFRAGNFEKAEDGRVKFEMSYGQFLRLIREGLEKQEEESLILKEGQHPVLEAIDMVFDLIAWIISLFLSPILEDDDKKGQKKEEDQWYDKRYKKLFRLANGWEDEDDSGTVRIYWDEPKAYETKQSFETAATFNNP